jgi:WD40 repeat protein
VIGGNYKRFLFGSFNPNQPDNQLRNLSVQKLEKTGGSTDQDKYVWAVDFVPKSPEKILATGDSDGYINIWNLNQCSKKNSYPSQKIKIACRRRNFLN